MERNEQEPPPKQYKFTIICDSLGQINRLKGLFKTNGRRVVYDDAADVLGQRKGKADNLTDRDGGSFGSGG